MTERQLAALFREAGSAHHRAFAATNGEDPEWAVWYADYLSPRLGPMVGRAFEVASLAADLRAVDAEHRRLAPAEPWAEYYARWFAPKLSLSLGPLRTLLLTGLLALFPFTEALARVPLTASAALLTALALGVADRAAARLGVFVAAYFSSILLGTAYSQLAFGAAILLYLLAIWRVPRLQGDQAWLRWGELSPVVQGLCLAVAVGAGLGLFVWHALARPDLSDLLERFVPDVGLPVLIVGGLLFSIVNAAVEEVAYRGILLDALRDVGLPIALAITLQAAAFGSIHIAGFPRGWSGVGLAAAYGAALGAIRIRAAGMLAPWLAHVLTDLAIVGIVLALA